MMNRARPPALGQIVHASVNEREGDAVRLGCHVALVTATGEGPDGRHVAVVVFEPEGFRFARLPVDEVEHAAGTIHSEH